MLMHVVRNKKKPEDHWVSECVAVCIGGTSEKSNVHTNVDDGQVDNAQCDGIHCHHRRCEATLIASEQNERIDAHTNAIDTVILS